jgi:hypothetical protein
LGGKGGAVGGWSVKDPLVAVLVIVTALRARPYDDPGQRKPTAVISSPGFAISAKACPSWGGNRTEVPSASNNPSTSPWGVKRYCCTIPVTEGIGSAELMRAAPKNRINIAPNAVNLHMMYLLSMPKCVRQQRMTQQMCQGEIINIFNILCGDESVSAACMSELRTPVCLPCVQDEDKIGHDLDHCA